MAYLPLSTANLPDPVIDPAQGASPEDYFGTLLFTATAGVADSVTGLGFAPDFSWTKARNASQSHQLFDNVRGDGVRLITNSTAAESDLGATYVSLEDDGIDYGSSTFSSNTYVAWNWKANGSGVTNTDGSITSTVSANTTSGFSIVSYTGNATAGATVGHGLNSAPEMVIVKDRDAATNWGVGHIGINGGTNPWDYKLHLDLTNAQSDDVNVWNDTAPTSSVVTLGAGGIPNGNTVAYIMYCFHSVEGFSKFGSYVGNNQTDAGPFVYLGFRPAFLLLKNTGSANWHLIDTKRSPYNEATEYLEPNASDAETDTTNHGVDILSNGFRPMTTAGFGEINGSGNTIIYMAFAETPFKYSNAR